MFPASTSRGGGGGGSVPPGDGHLLCSYPLHVCSREKFAGHDFCLRHILDDRSAPFKQCNYTFTKTQGNNPPRRCPRPAPKADRKDGFCVEHSRKALMARQKSNANRLAAGIAVKRTASLAGLGGAAAAGSTAKLMDDLAPYKVPKVEPDQSTVKNEAGVDKKPVVKPDILDTLAARRTPSASHGRGMAVDSSELDSDDDPQAVDATWNGNDDNSDAESVDSELDNPLKHAGTYSAEEVVRIMREKLIRLQKLYIDQFQRLRYLLKEEGRNFKHNVLAEKEAELSSIHSQLKTSLEDVLAYDKIKALNHYQRPQGLEAVLHHAFLERRAKLGEPASANTTSGSGGATAGGSASGGGAGPSSSSSAAAAAGGATTSSGGYHFKPTVLPKCSFHVTSSTKCGEAVVPLSKFCIKHVLEDSGQVLFRTCGHVAVNAGGADNVETADPSDDGPCETPIADVLDSATCVFHTQFHAPFSSRGPSSDKKPPLTKPSCDEQDLTATGGTVTAKVEEQSVKNELEQQQQQPTS